MTRALSYLARCNFGRLAVLGVAVLLLPALPLTAQQPSAAARPAEEQYARMREEMKRMMMEMEKFQDQMMEQMLENRTRLDMWRHRLNDMEPQQEPRPEAAPDGNWPPPEWRERMGRWQRDRQKSLGKSEPKPEP